MTNKIANELRVMYNEQNPHCPPENAATRLHAMEDYKGPLYVQLVMHADKTKVFFGGLKAKKKRWSGARAQLEGSSGRIQAVHYSASNARGV